MLQSKGAVRCEVRDDVTLFFVGGEVDHHSAVNVRTSIDAILLAEKPLKVMLELSSVDFMDSSGLGLIMGRYALVKQYGGTFAVLDPSPAVLKIMKLAGMERMISILRTKNKTWCIHTPCFLSFAGK